MILVLLVGAEVSSKDFVTFLNKTDDLNQEEQALACCKSPLIVSCRQVKIHPAVLGQKGGNIALPNIVVQYIGPIADNPKAFYYKGKDGLSNVVITCNKPRTRKG